MLQNFTNEEWVENFRISKPTFMFLCQQVKKNIEQKNTHLRDSISVQQRIAVTLWYLATCTEYRTIEHLFGIARSTVCLIIHDICQANVDLLLRKYIQFPKGQQLHDVVNGFKTKSGMIQCCGAIDGTHIPVTPPFLEHTDYSTEKDGTLLFYKVS